MDVGLGGAVLDGEGVGDGEGDEKRADGGQDKDHPEHAERDGLLGLGDFNGWVHDSFQDTASSSYSVSRGGEGRSGMATLAARRIASKRVMGDIYEG